MAADIVTTEISTKLPSNPVVDRIKTILSEAKNYEKVHREWDAESKLRRDNNQEINPEPPIPESYPAAKVLTENYSNYFNTTSEIIKDISEATHPEDHLLGYPMTDETRASAKEKLETSKSRIDTLVEELGNYSGADVDPPEMVKIIRASALIDTASKNSFDLAGDILAKTIVACPEVLLTDEGSGFSRYILERLSTNSIHYYQNPNLAPILTALVSEDSHLSPPDSEKAKYYQTELMGFNLFQTMKVTLENDIRQMPLSSILKVLDVNLSSEVLAQVSNPNKALFAIYNPDIIPLVLARISNYNGVSSNDKDKLRTEVVGYVKAMEVDSSKKESYYQVDKYGSLNLKQSALDRKVAAAQAAAEIIGTDFPMVELVGERKPSTDDPVINELYSIFCPSINGMSFGSTLDQVLTVMRKQGEDFYNKIKKEDNEKKVALQEQKKQEEEKKRKAKISEARETQRLVEVFNSPKIQKIFNSVNISHPEYTTTIREALSQAEIEIDRSSQDFIAKVLDRIDSISTKYVQRTKITVPGKKGFLGIGATPDTEETHINADKQKIQIELDTLNTKKSNGSILGTDDEAYRLALEQFRKLPGGEFIAAA